MNKNNRQLKKLVIQAAEIAQKHAEINKTLTEVLVERYGVDFHDYDIDELIDTFDYGLEPGFTLVEIDAIMLKHGFPVRKNKSWNEKENKN